MPANLDHLADHHNLVFKRSLPRAGQRTAPYLQGLDELVALFRHQLDAVGGQELVVASAVLTAFASGFGYSRPACTS